MPGLWFLVLVTLRLFFSDMDHSIGQNDVAAGAVPPLPSADADDAFQPVGVAIHLNPMASRPKFRVQVRLGNGPDCPIVQPPATVWFGLDGRLQAVARPMTSSEADDLEFEDKEEEDIESIDVDIDKNEDGVGDDAIADEKVADSNGPSNDNGPIIVDVNDDDDDEVVFLGEFKNNSAKA